MTMRQLNIKDPELVREVADAAAAAGLSKTEIVRRAVRAFRQRPAGSDATRDADVDARMARALEIRAAFAVLRGPGDWPTDDDLYDSSGLPRRR